MRSLEKKEIKETQDWKKELRKQGLSKRDNLSDAYRSLADEQILHRLCEMKEYRQAELILVYVSYKSEVDTKQLIIKALSEGKRVAVPKVINRNGEMEFYGIDGLFELEKGYQGIEEPIVLDKQPICLSNEEMKLAERGKDCNLLMILPGAVFDANGNRIGYGGGFYDRYLQRQNCERLQTVAVCYEEQLVNQLPAELHDYRVKCVVTERRICIAN